MQRVMGKVLGKYGEVLQLKGWVKIHQQEVDGGWASSLSLREGWRGEPAWWVLVMANILFP